MPFSLLNEHTCTPLCRLSPCCCSLTSYASFPSLRWSLFTSQFAQNGQWRKRVLHSVISVFTTSRLLFSGCLYSAPLYTKCESVDLEVCFWDITSYEKNKEIKALTFTTKHGSWSGSKNNNGKKIKEKLPYQSVGEEVANTYAHPCFLPGRPAPRQPFLLS